MRRLRTKKQAYKYKSSTSWIDAVYRENKKFIDEKIGGKGKNNLNQFKNLILDELGYIDPTMTKLSKQKAGRLLNKTKKIDIRKALDDLSRSDVFASYEERQSLQAYNTLYAYKDVYKVFRKQVGWKESIDPMKFEWVGGSERIYKYKGKRGTIYLNLEQSPEYSIYIMQTINGKEVKTVLEHWSRDEELEEKYRRRF